MFASTTRVGLIQALGAMRYIIASFTAVLLVFAGVALAGAGHGWVPGGFGCFALAPVSFLAIANGLSRAPSIRFTVSMLAAGLALCGAVAAATTLQGTDYFSAYFRATAPFGAFLAISAYIGYLLVATLATVRARRVSRHGT